MHKDLTNPHRQFTILWKRCARTLKFAYSTNSRCIFHWLILIIVFIGAVIFHKFFLWKFTLSIIYLTKVVDTFTAWYWSMWFEIDSMLNTSSTVKTGSHSVYFWMLEVYVHLKHCCCLNRSQFKPVLEFDMLCAVLVGPQCVCLILRIKFQLIAFFAASFPMNTLHFTLHTIVYLNQQYWINWRRKNIIVLNALCAILQRG